MNNQTQHIYRKQLIWVFAVEIIGLVILMLLFTMARTNTVQFLYPKLLLIGLILPLVALWNLYHWRKKLRWSEHYSNLGKTRMLWVRYSFNETFWPYFFFRSCLFFLIIAMAQPVAGSKKIKGNKRVMDLVICLDISNSMNTKDMGGGNASRLTAAKNAINELLNKMTGERIAVVIFANDAYVQLPLTMDYGAAKLFIPDIETSMISDQGTNIGKALEVAQTQFKDAESGQAILVVTDGEDHEDLWKEQVKLLQEKKVALSYLGLGSEKGGLIPENPFDMNQGYKRENGKAIVSKIDHNALMKMADATGSMLSVSDSEFPSVQELITDFKSVKNKHVAIDFVVAKNYFAFPTLLAFISLLCYLYLPSFFQSKSE